MATRQLKSKPVNHLPVYLNSLIAGAVWRMIDNVETDHFILVVGIQVYRKLVVVGDGACGKTSLYVPLHTHTLSLLVQCWLCWRFTGIRPVHRTHKIECLRQWHVSSTFDRYKHSRSYADTSCNQQSVYEPTVFENHTKDIMLWVWHNVLHMPPDILQMHVGSTEALLVMPFQRGSAHWDVIMGHSWCVLLSYYAYLLAAFAYKMSLCRSRRVRPLTVTIVCWYACT